jgi:O-antigen ligase
MHEIGPNTIATWICVALVILVILGVLRALVRPIVAVALIAILLIFLGVLREETVARFARETVHQVHQFVASLFSAAR